MYQASRVAPSTHPTNPPTFRYCIFCGKPVTDQVYATVAAVRANTRRGPVIAYRARAHALCAQERLHVGR